MVAVVERVDCRARPAPWNDQLQCDRGFLAGIDGLFARAIGLKALVDALDLMHAWSQARQP